MTYTQTVEIPADRRIVVEAPREIPTGSMITLTFTSIPGVGEKPETREKSAAETAREMWDSLPTIEDCKREAAAKYAARKASGVDPLEQYRGSGIFGHVDGVTYQRSIRDEWPD
ncbi:MAG: hypothetical protein Pg6C_01850 [Treponemataceae bacterium]|nr:MAG: hypothetical protein Pg6C_01850 [Treponemataceae bacterium]